jgi:hypothetical protein
MVFSLAFVMEEIALQDGRHGENDFEIDFGIDLGAILNISQNDSKSFSK